MYPDASNNEDTEVMTPAEAAAWLKLKELGHVDPIQTVLHLRDSGQITKRKIAGRVAFTLADLRTYVRGTIDRHEVRRLYRPQVRQVAEPRRVEVTNPTPKPEQPHRPVRGQKGWNPQLDKQ